MSRTSPPGARALRAPGAILLVSCYELGHQPLGLAFPLAFLERAGFRPSAVDLAVSRLDAEAVRRARLVAISVPMHTALRIGVEAAAEIRRLNSGCTICFYGLYAALNRAYLLAGAAGGGGSGRGTADVVLAGEIEEPLVALAERLDRGEDAAGGRAPGTRPAEDAPAADARAVTRLARQDFPVPSRGALPVLGRYAALDRDGERRVAGVTEASRGCLHLCRHCPIPPVYGGRFFVVPAAVVLEDVRRQAAAGARHITFADPDFLNGPTHALRIVEALHAELPDLTFDFTAKVEHLLRHRGLLPRFARAGCAFIVTAVESLSDEVLRKLDKGHSRADVMGALDAVRGAGMTLRPSFVPFTPWTTLGDYIELVDWLEAADLVPCVEPVQLAIRLLVPPGSGLLESGDLTPYLRGLDAAAFTWRWEHPDPRMERLHAQVSDIVHRASHAGTPAAEVHAAVRRAAREARGDAVRPPEAAATLSERRPVPPRLTEPWFC